MPPRWLPKPNAPEPRLRRSDVPRAEAAVIAVEMIQVETRQG